MKMNQQYVDGGSDSYRVAGSGVSLDSVVYGFLRGESAETIAQNFPALSLEQTYGAIAFYLANRDDVDAYPSAAECRGRAAPAGVAQQGSHVLPEMGGS